MPVAIGSPIRSDTTIQYGTVGCYATDGAADFLVTCDHVVKLRNTPEDGPWDLFEEYTGVPTEPVARYNGRSLCKSGYYVADILAAEVLQPVPRRPGRLPRTLPSGLIGDLAQAVPPAQGTQVFIWGARTRTYHLGTIREAASAEYMPHQKYGNARFQLQFSIDIYPSFIPTIGDSGGLILTAEGGLVGLLNAGPSACLLIEDSCVAFGVPIVEGLSQLGLTLLT